MAATRGRERADAAKRESIDVVVGNGSEPLLDEAQERERLFLYLTATQWSIVVELFNGATISARAAKDVSAVEDFLDLIADHPDFAGRVQAEVRARQKKREARKARWVAVT